VAIGFTRLALGVHWLSDVLAGWALGAGWLAVTTALFRTWQTEQGRVSPPVGQGLEAHGTSLAPVHERLLPDGGRTVAPLAGTAVALLSVAVGLCLLSPPSSGAALAPGALLAALSAPWTLLTLTLAASVLVLAVSRRRRPALLPVTAVLGAVVVAVLAAAAVPGGPSWHAAGAAAAYGSLGVLLVVRGRSRWRWAVLVPAAALAALSAGSRADAGWPAVLIGALVGTVWLAACVRWLLLPGTSPEPYPEALRNPSGPVGARR
jgi:undecaprenyl-diphosphatase